MWPIRRQCLNAQYPAPTLLKAWHVVEEKLLLQLVSAPSLALRPPVGDKPWKGLVDKIQRYLLLVNQDLLALLHVVLYFFLCALDVEDSWTSNNDDLGA